MDRKEERHLEVYLVDGTYELFRAYFALPALESPAGKPVGAVHGLIQSLLRLIRENGVTHIGCAFDSVIPSFRNELFPGYKTGEGTPPELLAQFELAERAVAALGVCVWPMVEFEADDAIAAATEQLRRDPAVERVVICSPDKDLAQLVEGERVICLDRRRGETIGENDVIAKYGVAPLPSQTCWPSPATQRTASPACPAGERRVPPPCCRATATWRTFPPTPHGTFPCAARRRCKAYCRRNTATPCSTANSPLSAAMSP